MPLLPAEQGQLATTLTKANDLELIRFGRLLYEAIQHEKLPTEKAILLGKQMLANLPWEKANPECRLALVPIARNIMERMHLIFSLEAAPGSEPGAEAPEAPETEACAKPEPAKVETLKPARPAKKNGQAEEVVEVVAESAAEAPSEPAQPEVVV